MQIEVAVRVNAPKSVVWKIVSDIENSAATIPAIQKIEVLERPPEGLVGFKWRETRTMFGKTAYETMTVSEAVEESYYQTHAESHGSIYRSRISVADEGGSTRLTMWFGAEPQTFGAKVMGTLFGPLFKGATRKALLKDLEDIKKVAESQV